MMRTRALIAALAALCLPSCTTEPAAPVPDEPVVLDDGFASAARAYDVPLDLLKAIAYVETRWDAVAPDDEHDDRPMAYGVFALRGDNLTRGAIAAGLDEAVVRTSTAANIAAAAARLAELAAEQAVTDPSLVMWAPVVAQFAQIEDDEARANYVDDVMRTLATGARSIGEDGAVIASLEPHLDIEMPQPGVAYGTSTDFSGAIWRASPNYSGRPSGVTMVVIHTCEGGYAGCWGWLRNSSAGVSAHYVVNESGSEVTQLVREASKAWHVSATYDCARAGNQQCSKNGSSVNNFSVGIEHAGYGSQASWSNGMIEISARLVCDITKRHNIPRDRNHIVSHGQLQPWNRTDPGANWPWAHYIDRVRAYCGDSGTPPPTTTTPSQIIVDSNNANNNAQVARIELTGSWTSSSSQAGYYGTGYWTAPTQQTSAPATFWFYLPQAQTRTVEAWWTSASNRASGAPFVAFNANDQEVGRRVVNQQQQGSQWVTLGTWSFSAGWNKVVLSRWAAAGQYVVADAVRIR